MDKDSTQHLYDKYPGIFADKDFWGFECGTGWFNIINNLCEALTDIAKEKEKPVVVAAQVKEKFGGLRFYTEGGTTKEEYALIAAAENESYKVCEDCGSKDNVTQTKTGWITTLCWECSNYVG